MFRLLKADEIEVKVKQVKENGSVFLLYKTARTDMDLLDETVGPMNWQSNYKVVNDNLYAGIGIRDKSNDTWVWKEDCGIESRPDGDGNEKKGEASDAFKRAGFKWGIGRELYTSPFIWISSDVLPTAPAGNVYKLKGFPKLEVSKIEYIDRKISLLELVDENGRTVYTFPKGNKTPVKVAPMTMQVNVRPDIQKMIDTVDSVDGLRNIFVLYKDECDEKVLTQACQQRKKDMGWA